MSVHKSSIPQLAAPEFKPNIPEHMLDTIESKTNRYIIEQLSVMGQQSAWQTHKLMNIYDYTRSINGKVVELEQFRNDLLLQMQLEDKLDEQHEIESEATKLKESKYQKHYRIAAIVFLAVLYPMYLMTAAETGIVDLVKKFIFIVQ